MCSLSRLSGTRLYELYVFPEDSVQQSFVVQIIETLAVPVSVTRRSGAFTSAAKRGVIKVPFFHDTGGCGRLGGGLPTGFYENRVQRSSRAWLFQSGRLALVLIIQRQGQEESRCRRGGLQKRSVSTAFWSRGASITLLLHPRRKKFKKRIVEYFSAKFHVTCTKRCLDLLPLLYLISELIDIGRDENPWRRTARAKPEDGDHFITLPEAMGDGCGKPKWWLYGMRLAAHAWGQDCCCHLEEAGMVRGKAAPTTFHNSATGAPCVGHGEPLESDDNLSKWRARQDNVDG